MSFTSKLISKAKNRVPSGIQGELNEAIPDEVPQDVPEMLTHSSLAAPGDHGGEHYAYPRQRGQQAAEE
ncbi:MAG: hypothetical protein GY774_15975 [Planctomycetes bacterium]|nr:hypothetical protein [Planctomycetota bacterium]